MTSPTASKLPGKPSSASAITAGQLHCSGGVTRPINALRQVRSKDALNAVFKISGSYRASWSSWGKLSPCGVHNLTGPSSQAYPKRRISNRGSGRRHKPHTSAKRLSYRSKISIAKVFIFASFLRRRSSQLLLRRRAGAYLNRGGRLVVLVFPAVVPIGVRKTTPPPRGSPS